MSYFKRFTDFCAGFTAFYAIIYVFGQFMQYNPADAEGTKEKLKLFFSKENYRDYRAFLILIILLIVSVVAGRIFERMPYISLAVSILPMVQIMLIYSDDKLSDRPMLYILLGLIHVSGNILHAISLDKADGKRRAFICANICGICAALLGIWVWRKAKQLSLLDDAAVSELGVRDHAILLGAENDEHSILLKISVIILATVVLSLILRDIYFIDVISSAVPFLYVLYLFSTEKLTLFAQTAFVVTLLYFAYRILILISEPMAKRKKVNV